jgi:glycosyltransferase involved in cell wall biosynthesis
MSGEGPVPDVSKDRGRAPRRVAVVCWDLGHNTAARAMAIADMLHGKSQVDLIGPLWKRFGGELWVPLRERRPTPISFGASQLTEFLAGAYGIALHRQPYDLVVVCKPRLPGLMLGALLQRANGCPIILDIDEDELFFDEAGEELVDVGPSELEALFDPTHAVGTALGAGLASHAPLRTVSNIALKNRFGGTIIRHAREERDFQLTPQARAKGRRALGARRRDFVVLFIGTPRPHKGLQVVIDALRQLRRCFVLHVVGVSSPKAFARQADCKGVRVVTHPLVPFSEVATLVAGGDAVVLMQDLSSPISCFQIPAKIAEGLAMGLPVIMTDAPPVADLSPRVILRADDAAGLARHLRRLREHDDEEAKAERRALFRSEFSAAINCDRMIALAEHGATLPAASFDEFSDRILSHAARAYAHHRNRVAPTPRAARTGVDMVIFWKQNDSGLYGRRSDMLTRYFARDPRIRSVLHFDAPISTKQVAYDATYDGTTTDHRRLLSQLLLDRRLGIADEANVHYRTMIYCDDEAQRRDPMTGAPIPTSADFADYVAAEAASLGIDPTKAIAWVCPVTLPFLAVHDELKFGTVACDIIDDQRRFQTPTDDVDLISQHYSQLLGISDHIFTNCQPNAKAFGAADRVINVVPNGAEVQAFDPKHVPRDDDRPVVAYVGNMRDRIDWKLLESVARARPDYRFELVGSAPANNPGHTLAEAVGNVSLLGIVSYSGLPTYLQGVDVCIVPHRRDSLTSSMNPLKIYNFYAAGVPIVSTPIENVEELEHAIVFATDTKEFTEAIDSAIARRRAGLIERDDELLATIDWQSRTTSILDVLLG